jgi:trimeric autotransporter adhesin
MKLPAFIFAALLFSFSAHAQQVSNPGVLCYVPLGGTTGQVLEKSSNAYCALQWANGGGGSSGVSSFSGDGSFAVNSTSTGAVTFTLGNAAAYSLWGNATGANAAPGYTNSPEVLNLTTSGSLTVLGNASLSGTTTFAGPIFAPAAITSGTVAANSYVGLNSSGQEVLGSGGTGASPAGQLNAIQAYATSATFAGSSSGNGLYRSTTTQGLIFLSNTTTSNLLSLGDNGADVTSYALGESALLAQSTTNLDNTAIGGFSLSAVTTGTNNTALGWDAGQSLTTDSYTTAIGSRALLAQAGAATTSATGNTAIGYAALTALTTGVASVAVGNNALVKATSIVGENTAIGVGACGAVTTGSTNLCLGYNAGSSINTGSSNIVIGSGGVITSASNSIAIMGAVTNNQNDAISIGFNSLAPSTGAISIGYETGANSSGANVIFIGYQAGEYVSSGAQEVALGPNAMLANSNDRLTAPNNTAVGYNALTAIAGTATGNTAIGASSLAATATNAAYNTALGYNSGALNTTGTGNIEIGYNTDSTVGTIGSDNILIGNSLALSTSSTTNTINIGGIWTVTGTGTASSAANTINGTLSLPNITNADAGDYMCWNSGTVEYDATACVASLRKYKENIEPLHNALQEALALQPVEFKFKKSTGWKQQVQIGLIADDVEKVDKRLAGYTDGGELETVDYARTGVLAIAALQEQQKEIQSIPALEADPCSHLNWLGRALFCK